MFSVIAAFLKDFFARYWKHSLAGAAVAGSVVGGAALFGASSTGPGLGCSFVGSTARTCSAQTAPIAVTGGSAQNVFCIQPGLAATMLQGETIAVYASVSAFNTTVASSGGATNGSLATGQYQLRATWTLTGSAWQDPTGSTTPSTLVNLSGSDLGSTTVSLATASSFGTNTICVQVNPTNAGSVVVSADYYDTLFPPSADAGIDAGVDSGASPVIASITPNECIGGSSKVAVTWTGGQTGTTTIQAVGESAPGTCTGTSSPVTCTCPTFPANGTGGTAVNATITVGGNISAAAASALLFHDTNLAPAALWSNFPTTGVQTVWLDTSGKNACDGGACNAPSANSPTTTVINGHNAASLTAASSQNFTFPGAICGNGRWSGAAVAKPNLQGAFIVLSGPGVTAGVVGDYGFGSTADQNLQGTDFSSGGPATDGGVTTGSLHFAGFIDNFGDLDGGSPTTYVQLDSTLSLPVTMLPLTSVSNFTIGSGYSAGFALYYDGVIGEHIIYCGGITLAALEREHQLFKTRWGTP